MPKYKVKTDQGTFAVELDREPESPEQLQELVTLQLQGKKADGDIARIEAETKAITDPSGNVIGSGQAEPTGGPVKMNVGGVQWGENIGNAIAAGGRQVKLGAEQIIGGPKSSTRQNIEGIAQAVGASPNVASGIGAVADAPDILGSAVMGALNIFQGAPIIAASEFMGDTVMDMALAQGDTPGGAAYLGTAANIATQLVAAPFLMSKTASGANSVLRNLPGAQTALRSIGQKVIEAIPSSLKPAVPSSLLYEQVKQAGNPAVPLPKYRRAAAATARSEAKLIKQGVGDPKLAQQATQAVTANRTPPTFDVIQDIQQRLGEKVGELRAKGGGPGLGKQKLLYKSLAEDLDNAASSAVGTGHPYTILKEANKAANREFAIGELDDIFDATMGKALAGQPREITSSNFNTALNKIRAERKSNPLFEKGFQEGKINHLDRIEKQLEELNAIKIRPPPEGGAFGAGRILRGTGVAGGIGGAIGGLIAGPPGAAIGASAGTAIGAGAPWAISRFLQSPTVSKKFINILKKEGHVSTDQLRGLATLTGIQDTRTQTFLNNVPGLMKSSEITIDEKIKAANVRDKLKRMEAEAEAKLKPVRTSVREVDSKKSEAWGIGIGIERMIGKKE